MINQWFNGGGGGRGRIRLFRQINRLDSFRLKTGSRVVNGLRGGLSHLGGRS